MPLLRGRDSVCGERLSKRVRPVDKPMPTRCRCVGEGDHSIACHQPELRCSRPTLICPASVCSPAKRMSPRCDQSRRCCRYQAGLTSRCHSYSLTSPEAVPTCPATTNLGGSDAIGSDLAIRRGSEWDMLDRGVLEANQSSSKDEGEESGTNREPTGCRRCGQSVNQPPPAMSTVGYPPPSCQLVSHLAKWLNKRACSRELS